MDLFNNWTPFLSVMDEGQEAIRKNTTYNASSCKQAPSVHFENVLPNFGIVIVQLTLN